ncbi:MAG: hypothetical protein Q7N50_01595 [Armatimonadota bacterium]|nr:hypothetical protein [Armatimonadota bacterium]
MSSDLILPIGFMLLIGCTPVGVVSYATFILAAKTDAIINRRGDVDDIFAEQQKPVSSSGSHKIWRNSGPASHAAT